MATRLSSTSCLRQEEESGYGEKPESEFKGPPGKGLPEMPGFGFISNPAILGNGRVLRAWNRQWVALRPKRPWGRQMSMTIMTA